MEKNQYKCSGNCLNCLPAQRGYCASQHAYSNMKVLDALMGAVVELKATVDEIRNDTKAARETEASVFDPKAPKAQKGSGAEE